MIDTIYTLLHNFTVVLPLVWRICIFISWIALVVLAIMLFILSLDIFYNKSAKQYPYNVFLDKIVPFIALLSPSITILKMSPAGLSWIEKFFYIIIIHILVLIPLMAYWSELRKWFTNENSVVSWSHPRFFFVLSLAMIYPMIWGIYFTGIRYLRLGQQREISDILIVIISPENLAYIFIFVTAFFNLWCYFIIILGNFLAIRNYLWHKTSLIIYSLHLELLTYNIYFKVMEKIFKLYFIWFSLISLNNYFNNTIYDGSYDSKHWLRKLLHKMYYKPLLLYTIIFTVCIVDILLFKNISHIYYFLFWFPILLALYKSFSTLGLSNFIIDVCKVDYLNQNLNNIRYPRLFWVYVGNPDLSFGLSRDIPEDVLQDWQNEYNKAVSQRKLYSLDLVTKIYEKINEKYPKNIANCYLRLKVAYYRTYGVHF